MAMAAATAPDDRWPNAGWAIGAIVIAAVLVAGTILWLSYHP